MKNERRLVDLDIAKKQFDDIPPFIGMTGKCVQEMLDGVPTVDAVEVVRCKDCKHYEHYDALLYCGHTRGLAGIVSPDAFCSYGERREET